MSRFRPTVVGSDVAFTGLIVLRFTAAVIRF